MIKVPATPAGVPAIEQTHQRGHEHQRHPDVFSRRTTRLSPTHIFADSNGARRPAIRSIASPRSPASSSAVLKLWSTSDSTTSSRSAPEEAIAALRGTAAIAGTRLIYQRFKEIFGSDRFKALAARGARVQRPLWASTGTKNPAYSDIKYVQELIGPDTVNTMPPATMDAYRDHGEPRSTLEQDSGGAREIVKRLGRDGIDLNEIGEELQKEGVDSFDKSFDDLIAVIKGRRDALVAGAQDRQDDRGPV